jgi:hypothetical protein
MLYVFNLKEYSTFNVRDMALKTYITFIMEIKNKYNIVVEGKKAVHPSPPPGVDQEVMGE